MKKTLFVWLFAVMAVASLQAQTVDPAILTPERLFASSDFFGQRFGPARWLNDGQSYTTLEPSANGTGRDIVQYDPATGARTVMVPASSLIPAGATSPLRIEDYSWSPDGGMLLVFTNSRRVWRQNTRGDFWALNLKSGRLHQLGGDAPPSTVMFAKFSPDASRVAYVRENNLYVERLSDGHITQLTNDGSKTLINGTFDWVNEEEFFLRDGFRWSPDGTQIAFWQLDASGVRDYLLINDTDSLYSFVKPVQYPKAGTTNSAVRVGVVPAGGGAIQWFEPSDDLRNHYIARMDWAANSKEIVMQHLNRKQNRLEIILGTAASGAITRSLWTKTVPGWMCATTCDGSPTVRPSRGSASATGGATRTSSRATDMTYGCSRRAPSTSSASPTSIRTGAGCITMPHPITPRNAICTAFHSTEAEMRSGSPPPISRVPTLIRSRRERDGLFTRIRNSIPRRSSNSFACRATRSFGPSSTMPG